MKSGKMATEAQRLMVLSLGKIHGCRQQRGGINLYKSLLVSKVLYRARSIAIAENSSPRKEQEEEDEGDQRVPEIVMKPDDSSNVTGVRDIEPLSPSHEEENAGNTITSGDMPVHKQCDDSYDYDKENVRPQSNIPQNYPVHSPEDFADSPESDNGSIDQRSRCVKRRMTEVEKAVESISPKKQRIDNNYDQQYRSEPMQVETTQITTLVHRFSSGFTGLLATDSDNTQCHEDSSSEVQGHADSLLSCSTQIKESFELLARPIALSV